MTNMFIPRPAMTRWTFKISPTLPWVIRRLSPTWKASLTVRCCFTSLIFLETCRVHWGVQGVCCGRSAPYSHRSGFSIPGGMSFKISTCTLPAKSTSGTWGNTSPPPRLLTSSLIWRNPRAGEHVKDPACGSGDFLISAFQHAARQNRADLRDSVWGSDNSAEAVQVAILNMVLNGDGKSQIRSEDSLLHISDYTDRFSVVLCNPPFGQRINETRQEVLRQFDLGHVWKHNAAGILEKTDKVAKRQQMGLLFAELCIRQTAPGGRVGIILPNGYLGNRSAGYVAFREWLIRHARIAAITAFPRFTFKKSGADVSASAVFMEKRSTPLTDARDAESHPFYAGMVESVGWQVGNKRSKRVFKRDLAGC